MASLKEKFLEGCAQTGTTPAVANQLWKDMESSQDYSFGKSHAACYALIAYRTAWLRANHSREYMAALISSVMNTKDRVPFYVSACHEMGIEVEPPDVNASEHDFAVVEGKIRFGLNAVKNVGDSAARAIVAARADGGPFTSIWDFTRARRPAGREQAGAGGARSVRRVRLDRRLARRDDPGARRRRCRGAGGCRPTGSPGQGSIFDLGGGEEESRPQQHPPVPAVEIEKNELLRMEKETLGVYVSEHPLQAIREQLRRKTDCGLAEAERRRDGEVVTVGGIVGAIKQLTTKKGEPMVFMRLDDLAGSRRGRGLQLGLRRVARPARARQRARRQGPRRPQAGGRDEADRDGGLAVRGDAGAARGRAARGRDEGAGRARPIAGARSSGSSRARPRSSSRISTSQGETTLALGPDYRVKPEPDFFAEVKSLLGEAAVA